VIAWRRNLKIMLLREPVRSCMIDSIPAVLLASPL
jgi:hypothetical protein